MGQQGQSVESSAMLRDGGLANSVGPTQEVHACSRESMKYYLGEDIDFPQNHSRITSSACGGL